MDADAALCERQRNPACSYSQLERRIAAGEIGQKVDRRGDRVGVPPLSEGGVVALGDRAGEVIAGHGAGR